MKKGSHIYIKCISPEGLSYTHHGIYCGDDMIIHYYNNKIRQTSISEFSGGQKIHVRKYKNCALASLVIKRAKSRKGERLYNLVFNNCEHFAYWCKTGKHRSEQVEKAPTKLLSKLDKNFKKKIKILSKEVSKKLIKENLLSISKMQKLKVLRIKLPKVKVKL